MDLFNFLHTQITTSLTHPPLHISVIPKGEKGGGGGGGESGSILSWEDETCVPGCEHGEPEAGLCLGYIRMFVCQG